MKIENLTDEELVSFNLKMNSEVERRIIELLKANNITQYTLDSDDEPEVEVFSLYSNKPSGDVIVQSIGYVRDQYESEVNEYVYILDDNANFYSSDEISDILHLYGRLKEFLSKK